jgi:hypothetical protein
MQVKIPSNKHLHLSNVIYEKVKINKPTSHILIGFQKYKLFSLKITTMANSIGNHSKKPRPTGTKPYANNKGQLRLALPRFQDIITNGLQSLRSEKQL